MFRYNPWYAIHEMEAQPVFDNPKVGVIRSAIKALEKEIRTLEGEIAISKLEYQEDSKR